jgi:hypothetical protein
MAPARPTRRKTRAPRGPSPEAPRPGAVPPPAAAADPPAPAPRPRRAAAAAVEAEEDRVLSQDEQMDSHRRVFDRLGLPAICPESACRRGRHCCGVRPGAPRRAFPPCFWIYREEIRFLLAGPLGLDAVMRAIETGELPTTPPTPGFAEWEERLGRAMQAMLVDRTAETLLEALYDRGTLTRIARARPPEKPVSWQADADGFARAMARAEWQPGRAAEAKADAPEPADGAPWRHPGTARREHPGIPERLPPGTRRGDEARRQGVGPRIRG